MCDFKKILSVLGLVALSFTGCHSYAAEVKKEVDTTNVEADYKFVRTEEVDTYSDKDNIHIVEVTYVQNSDTKDHKKVLQKSCLNLAQATTPKFLKDLGSQWQVCTTDNPSLIVSCSTSGNLYRNQLVVTCSILRPGQVF